MCYEDMVIFMLIIILHFFQFLMSFCLISILSADRYSGYSQDTLYPAVGVNVIKSLQATTLIYYGTFLCDCRTTIMSMEFSNFQRTTLLPELLVQ